MATPTTSPSPAGKPCPCGSGIIFENCCGPVIDGSRPAATAEELMRSRFTAHVIQDHGYLHRTYEGTRHRPFVDEPDSSPIQWTRLEVHSHDAEVRPDVSHVDFSAYFHEEGEERTIQEKSEFRRVKGAWYYTKALRSGPAPLKSTAPKIGRNDPCPCGSGKKFKNCHLGKPL